MAIDLFGILVAGGFILWIAAVGYKKKTGNNLFDFLKRGKEKVKERFTTDYKRVYVNRGIKT